MKRNLFLNACLAVSIAMPLVTAAALSATRSADEGCECEAAKCSLDPNRDCYTIICSDPEQSKVCKGRWNET